MKKASLLFLFLALAVTSCRKDDEPSPIGEIEKTYIVISDTHFGDARSIDEGYGWNISMRDTLVAFLDYVKDNGLCDELIVDGDFVDEWVAPPDYAAFEDEYGNVLTESEFFEEIVKTNSDVFDKFAELAAEGTKLVYVPGNHDMQVTEEDFARVLPGIFVQARTAGVAGMGEYQPDPEIFIEHGHRYDIMNAPYSGKGIEGSILPPGFFVSKLACGYKMKTGQNAELTKCLDNISYNVGWAALGLYYGKEDVATMTDGMTRTYAFKEYAYNTCDLFRDIDDPDEENDGWNVRCDRIGARYVPEVTESILCSAEASVCDRLAMQVLEDTGFEPHVLVWGHSHSPELKLSDDKRRVYVNVGCWIDSSECGDGNNSTFCRIIKTPEGEYQVSLCRFKIGSDGQGSVETISETTL